MSKIKSDRLRIAMLGHKRVPSREGGVEIVVGELSTRMVAQGHECTCFNRKGHHVSGSDFDEVLPTEYGGVRLKTVWALQKRGLAAMTASVTAAVCAAFGKYDVVHFHAEGPCAMLWLPKLFGKRCIATIHGLDHKRAKWGRLASAYIHLGEKCAVRFADEIIVLSRNVQEYFRETYGRETVLIPNGVTPANAQSSNLIEERFGLQSDEYILYLGRLVPEKCPDLLIEAYLKTDTDKRLVIAGGSSDTLDFENELKSKADDNRIVFTGFVQGELLEQLYANAYIYVLPSNLEGMPLSLLEAMSYGNCCLTSDIPECADVIEDHGVTFKKGDVNDLTDKLSYLCNNPDTVNRYRETAADFICGKYSWDDVTGRTLKLYGLTDLKEEIKKEYEGAVKH